VFWGGDFFLSVTPLLPIVSTLPPFFPRASRETLQVKPPPQRFPLVVPAVASGCFFSPFSAFGRKSLFFVFPFPSPFCSFLPLVVHPLVAPVPPFPPPPQSPLKGPPTPRCVPLVPVTQRPCPPTLRARPPLGLLLKRAASFFFRVPPCSLVLPLYSYFFFFLRYTETGFARKTPGGLPPPPAPGLRCQVLAAGCLWFVGDLSLVNESPCFGFFSAFFSAVCRTEVFFPFGSLGEVLGSSAGRNFGATPVVLQLSFGCFSSLWCGNRIFFCVFPAGTGTGFFGCVHSRRCPFFAICL